MMKERLSTELEDVESSLARTQGYLSEMRKGNPQMVADAPPDALHANPVLDLESLEVEVEHILDTIHQVEVDIEDLQSLDPSPSRSSHSVAPSPVHQENHHSHSHDAHGFEC